MDNEELVALALTARAMAIADDSLASHYMWMRDVCWRSTGIDVALVGQHMDRLALTARADA